jgi:hypothetical protein
VTDRPEFLNDRLVEGWNVVGLEGLVDRNASSLVVMLECLNFIVLVRDHFNTRRP